MTSDQVSPEHSPLSQHLAEHTMDPIFTSARSAGGQVLGTAEVQHAFSPQSWNLGNTSHQLAPTQGMRRRYGRIIKSASRRRGFFLFFSTPNINTASVQRTRYSMLNVAGCFWHISSVRPQASVRWQPFLVSLILMFY